MNLGKSFPDGLSFLLGASVAVVAFSIGHALAGDTLVIQIKWLQRWQTLVTGMLALMIGWLTIRAVRDQIRLAQEQEADRVDRRLYAAKTALPAALAALSDYSKASIRTCVSFLKHVDDNDLLDDKIDMSSEVFPAVPSFALSAVQTCVEFETGTNRDSLSWPLDRVQILQSRQATIYDSSTTTGRYVVTGHALLRRIVEHLEFQVRLNQCFKYARRQQNIPSIDTSIDFDRLWRWAVVANSLDDSTRLNECIEELVNQRLAGGDV